MSSKYKSKKRVHDSDDEAASSTKKTKTASKTVSAEAQKDEEGNTYWELSNSRRVGVSEFKGLRMVNIREYYQQDGVWKPGRKGISLPMDQVSALMAALPQVLHLLSTLGEQVTAPTFDQKTSDKGGENGSGHEDAEVEEAKQSRGNHELTSDEE